MAGMEVGCQQVRASTYAMVYSNGPSLPIISQLRLQMHSVSLVAVRLPLILFAVILAGCDSASDNALSCNLEAGPITTGATATVEYSATVTGDADLDALVYAADAGVQTVSGATSPWSLTRTVASGTTVSLSMDASVRDGAANISMVVTESSGGGTFTVSDSDSCSQSI